MCLLLQSRYSFRVKESEHKVSLQTIKDNKSRFKTPLKLVEMGFEVVWLLRKGFEAQVLSSVFNLDSPFLPSD